MIGGCMGMCAERANYQVEIMREVPGTNNFATAVKLPGSYNQPNANIMEQVIPIG